MALADVALLVGQHAGHQTAHGVRHRHRGDLSAGQDEVPQGDLLVHTGFHKALVHALIVAAYQHQMVIVPLQASGGILRIGPALRRKVDYPAAQFARS